MVKKIDVKQVEIILSGRPEHLAGIAKSVRNVYGVEVAIKARV